MNGEMENGGVGQVQEVNNENTKFNLPTKVSVWTKIKNFFFTREMII